MNKNTIHDRMPDPIAERVLERWPRMDDAPRSKEDIDAIIAEIRLEREIEPVDYVIH